MPSLSRRQFAVLSTGLLCGDASAAPSSNPVSVPVIDTHIHLFDPTRPQGVPWPPKEDTILYRPALPDRFRKLAEPLGVIGAIEIEASPWVEDNQWVLDQAAQSSIIVGTVGNLEPGHPAFHQLFDRFHKNPLFRGIRYGNLWNRDLAARLQEPAFLADLKVLADANLVLDTANPSAALVRTILQVSDKLPDLRIVVDHLPHLAVPMDRTARNAYEADLIELGKRPHVFCKVSEVLNRFNGTIPKDVAPYRVTLDHLWNIFGQDRLLFGSDWPNSDPWGTYAEVLSLVREYFNGKGRAVAEKFFWKNSLAAYRWVRRDQSQPSL